MNVFITVIFFLGVNSLPHFHKKRNFKIAKNLDTLTPEQWYTQRLNHFDESDLRTWKQRYWTNATFFNPKTGPIFIMIGGEGEENPIWMHKGQWIEYAIKFEALCVMLEHRFYGKSRPAVNLSVENLKYLSSEQALADLASFRQHIHLKLNATNANKWISFGGSYPGSLSAWLRLKYPHLVHAAVSSSAPMKAILDFSEYLSVVNISLEFFAPGCSKYISQATNEIEQIIRSENGRRALERLFKTCDKIESNHDITNFHATVAGNLENVVQYNRDNRAFEGAIDANLTIDTVCAIMSNSGIGTPLYRYTVVNALLLQTYNQSCLDASYKKYINYMRQVEWNASESVGGRQWMWQTCIEFGFYQSTNSTAQPFGQTIPIEFFTKQCREIFGNEYDEHFIQKSIEHTNTNYGAFDYYGSRVIFVTHGIDPWHALGFYKQAPNNYTQAYHVKSTAHCADMYPSDDANDENELKESRRKIVNSLHKWLQES